MITALVCMVFSGNPAESLDDNRLEKIQNGFEKRRQIAFQKAKGEQLEIAEIEDPISPGRGRFSRDFSYSIIDFSMAALWNNEQIKTANEALIKNAEFYINNPGARNDRDSFYWAGDVLCRIVELFGENGSKAPGRLSNEAENKIFKMMWTYVETNSKVDSLDEVHDTYEDWNWGNMKQAGFPPLPLSASLETNTWDVIESENHHAQKFTVLWHFSKLLSNHPDYRNREYADGHTAEEHHQAWTRYLKEYIRQRAKKGLFIEMANGFYNAHTLKGFYNFHDFAEDRELRTLAGHLLDLYFASWAQEQINGVRSGGRSRMYKHWILSGERNPIRSWMWFYLGIGSSQNTHGSRATVATSRYRLPLVVMDIALDRKGRGSYEIHERRPGLAHQNLYTNPHYQLRTDFGGVVRYSYVTPEFIMGIPLLEARPSKDWTLISSQNRRQGVIFSSHRKARIIPICTSDSPTFNEQWGVQKKGAMITQELPGNGYSRRANGLRVWFSKPGLDDPIDQGRWAFTRTPDAYAAVRPARGGYSWQEPSDDTHTNGVFMTLKNGQSPVIIQVARARRFSSFRAFQNEILDRSISWENNHLTYKNLQGDTLTLPAFTDEASPGTGTRPMINGEAIDLAPAHVFHSPFIRSRWNSGLVKVEKDDRSLTLDFR